MQKPKPDKTVATKQEAITEATKVISLAFSCHQRHAHIHPIISCNMFYHKGLIGLYYCSNLLTPVSYTHLDVYKRQSKN